MTTRMIVTPHALTQWNVEGRIQGHADVPLNETGRAMADALASRIQNEGVAAVYASDLCRAVQTAQPSADLLGLDVRQDMRLREGRSVGCEPQDKYPLLPFPREREFPEDVLERMVAALSEIGEANRGRTVLVVSHAGALGLFFGLLLAQTGWTGPRYMSRRTAVNVANFNGRGFWCESLNDDRHLQGLGGNLHANRG